MNLVRLVAPLAPGPVIHPEGGLPLPALETRLVEAVLLRFDGNKNAAARYLGVPRHMLLYRLEKYVLK